VDSSDRSRDAYRDKLSAGLLYLEDNSTRYPEEGNKGWLPTHAKTKPMLWTSTYPAELEDTMKETDQACISPRYVEGDVEIARYVWHRWNFGRGASAIT